LRFARFALFARAQTMMRSAAAPSRLLDLPDELLERILLTASNGGQCCELRSARLACARLRSVSYAAARHITVQTAVSSAEAGLTALAVLPRLGYALTRVQVALVEGAGNKFDKRAKANAAFFVQNVEEIVQAVYK
jgi:hypothetical protein